MIAPTGDFHKTIIEFSEATIILMAELQLHAGSIGTTTGENLSLKL